MSIIYIVQTTNHLILRGKTMENTQNKVVLDIKDINRKWSIFHNPENGPWKGPSLEGNNFMENNLSMTLKTSYDGKSDKPYKIKFNIRIEKRNELEKVTLSSIRFRFKENYIKDKTREEEIWHSQGEYNIYGKDHSFEMSFSKKDVEQMVFIFIQDNLGHYCLELFDIEKTYQTKLAQITDTSNLRAIPKVDLKSLDQQTKDEMLADASAQGGLDLLRGKTMENTQNKVVLDIKDINRKWSIFHNPENGPWKGPSLEGNNFMENNLSMTLKTSYDGKSDKPYKIKFNIRIEKRNELEKVTLSSIRFRFKENYIKDKTREEEIWHSQGEYNIYGKDHSFEMSFSKKDVEQMVFIFIQDNLGHYCLELFDIEKTYQTKLAQITDTSNLRAIPKVDLKSLDQQTKDEMLADASAQGDLDLLNELLAAGANIEAKIASFTTTGDYGTPKTSMTKTPLLIAIENKQLEVVKALIEKGANIMFRDENRDTVLTWASWIGSVEIFKELFKAAVKIGKIKETTYKSPGKIDIRGEPGFLNSRNTINKTALTYAIKIYSWDEKPEMKGFIKSQLGNTYQRGDVDTY